jgi:hypothetical protein
MWSVIGTKAPGARLYATCRDGREHGGSVNRSRLKVLRLVFDTAVLHKLGNSKN